MAAPGDVRSDALPNLVLVHTTALYVRYPVVGCTQMHSGVQFQRAAITVEGDVLYRYASRRGDTLCVCRILVRRSNHSVRNAGVNLDSGKLPPVYELDQFRSLDRGRLAL